ncbi:MAG: FKBP-type peptidyl-prolyl cis-trans isomerase [Pseudomonadota bacterium]|nr:FKBP-type peptidyl-prolyl cis-trans isomerase [Pseudomonadota bacterium]
MSSRIASVLALAATLLGGCATTQPRLATDRQQISYVVGYRIGLNLRSEHMDVNHRVLLMAIRDAEHDRPSRLSAGQTRTAIATYQHRREKEFAAQAQKNLVAGEKFLAANRSKAGVVTLPSGLQYKIVVEGKGRRPAISDTVVASYRGMHIDGREFDSSHRHGGPATFPVSGVIRGWQQALQLMPVGSRWRIFVPADLAYGATGSGSVIGPDETLVFDIQLLNIR